MKKTLSHAPLALALAAISLAAGAAPAPSKVQAAVTAQEQIDKNAAASQKKVDAVTGGTQDMLNTYLQVTQQTDELRAYDDQLQQIVQSQSDQINSLNQQISQVGGVRDSLLPLMLQMTDSLGQFVKLDIPYRQDERLARVQQLRAQIGNVAVPVTDKFQNLVRAYNDEIAAGRTVEAFRGEVSDAGKTRTVNFLRVGHLLLAYQTLDKSETGYWDKAAHKWQVANDYRNAVSDAIGVANKEAAPDLMELPVQAPEVGK
jgi:septal ring factor EnvC (AmiA/AmiB activator)